MGIMVDALRAVGWGAAGAYRATFAIVLALQGAAVAWMLLGRSGRKGAAAALSAEQARH